MARRERTPEELAAKRAAQRALYQHLNQTVNRDPDPRVVQTRLRNMWDATPEQVKTLGRQWYPSVHDAAAKAAHSVGKDVRAGAGVVAAVSPGMDWENQNIHAFDDLDRFTPRDWRTIQESARGKSRNEAAKAVVAGTSLSRASDDNLLKAHRIWNLGEDPDEVLDRTGAPKTNSFYHNILEPHKDGMVTVDGRHADIITDGMRPWEMDRGISSAQLKTGKPTRYEQYSQMTADAAHHLGVLPHELQAGLWEHGKLAERNYNPARKQGDTRRGQSYMERISRQFGGSGL